MSDDEENNDNDDAYLEVANNQIKLVLFASNSTSYLYRVVSCTRYSYSQSLHSHQSNKSIHSLFMYCIE